MRSVLVTGAFGYLGLAVLARLAGDYRVVGCGHPPRNPLAKARIPANVETVYDDILDVAEIIRQRGPFDGVLHLAGGGGPQKCADDPGAAVRANVRGTSELAAAARQAGIPRLVYASTIAVYGTLRVPTGPYAETDAALPDDLYGIVKEAAEHLWTQLGGGTSLRIANIYGAGAGVDIGVNGAVERFARAAAAGDVLRIFGTGEQRIDYVHIEDVVSAFRLALEAKQSPPVVNVGGGAPISIAELAQACMLAGEGVGARPQLVREPAPSGKVWPDRSLSIELASRTLGWRPQVSYDRGVAELVGMMRQGGETQ